MNIDSHRFQFGDLRGRTLLLTGTTRGIGRAILPILIEQGLRVIGIDRDIDEMIKIRDELNVSEDQFVPYQCDLSSPEEVANIGEVIFRAHPNLDSILHNAAIDDRNWFENSEDEFWNRVMQVNFFSAVALTRKLLPNIRRSEQGRIIFTGSIISELGGACLSAYSASKGAVLATTRSLAHELCATHITVNCIIPGAIHVEKEPEGIDETVISWQCVPRRLDPLDLVGAVCLLLSRWGAGITGQSITIDGGILHPLASPNNQKAML